MQILTMRPAPPGGGNTLCRFDVQLDGIRLHNVSLKRTGAGLRVFAPSAFGCAAVTFTPEIAAELIALVHGEITANGTKHAA
jgi:hypothetical protein